MLSHRAADCSVSGCHPEQGFSRFGLHIPHDLRAGRYVLMTACILLSSGNSEQVLPNYDQ